MNFEIETGIQKPECLGARLNNKLANVEVQTSLSKQEAGADDCLVKLIRCAG